MQDSTLRWLFYST